MSDDLYQELSTEVIEIVLIERGQKNTFLEKQNTVKKEFIGAKRHKEKELLIKVEMEAVGKGAHIVA